MKIHLLASRAHYGQHIHAIWKHLPEKLRGHQWLGKDARTKILSAEDVVMVAGFDDISCTTNRVIYVEHGAGQRYKGLPDRLAAYYHGGKHPDNVIAYLGPRQEVIDAWDKPGYACGAPICDPFELFAPHRVAAITFHWTGSATARNCPEAGTALHHYLDHLGDIVKTLQAQGYTVLGHRHPRLSGYASLWERHGIIEASIEEVRRGAELLIADNTSLMYEMSYLNRGVIAVNAPWYRRDVEHGLRFWEHAPVVQADDADELIKIIERNQDLEGDWQINERVYGQKYSDGRDGVRAAAWVTAFVSSI